MSRFGEPQHPDFRRLNASIGFDRRLWPQDIAQSRAHARMLAARGIIGERGAATRCSPGSTQVEAELREDRFEFRETTRTSTWRIERRLTEIAGPVGGRLHTARSRNDQVATDLALYARERARAGARARAAA